MDYRCWVRLGLLVRSSTASGSSENVGTIDLSCNLTVAGLLFLSFFFRASSIVISTLSPPFFPVSSISLPHFILAVPMRSIRENSSARVHIVCSNTELCLPFSRGRSLCFSLIFSYQKQNYNNNNTFFSCSSELHALLGLKLKYV